MNENGEGNPAVEQAEQQTLGTSTYQKVEVAHQYADTHPWLHPLLIAIGLIIVAGIVFAVLKMRRKDTF